MSGKSDRLGFLSALLEQRQLVLLLTPMLLYFVVFHYIPMIGHMLAFVEYRYDTGIFRSPFIGLKNFEYLWKSGKLASLTWNTVFFNFIFLVVNRASQVALAVMITETGLKAFRKISVSLIFLPFFVSYIIVGAIAYSFFNFEHGLLNSFLAGAGLSPVDIYGSPNLWLVIIPFFHWWKWVGYGTIIFVAAISSIPSEQYESATIDGAGVVQRIRYITIPFLMPSIVTLTLLNIGQIFRGQFELFYQLIGRNALLFDRTDVIDTYVFRSLIANFDPGQAAAANFYQSVLSLVTVLAVNALVQRWRREYALF